MSAAWHDGFGIVRWPMALSVVALAALAIWTSLKLFGRQAKPDAQTKVWIDAILFWGGFAALSGALGTLLRITIAAQNIEAAGEISATLLWGGIKIALLRSGIGLVILLIASIVWFVLQTRWKLLATSSP